MNPTEDMERMSALLDEHKDVSDMGRQGLARVGAVLRGAQVAARGELPGAGVRVARLDDDVRFVRLDGR